MSSDNSSFADIVPAHATAPATDSFETECFDADDVRTRYGIDTTRHCGQIF